MKTKLLAWTTCAALLAVAPYVGVAQGIGLQMADTADPGTAGQVEVVPGVTMGDDTSFYGLRASYSIYDELRAFMDMGLVDADRSEADMGGQVGALMRLPTTDFICDVGLRTAAYFANTDNLDALGLNAMVVFSGESLLDDLYLYSGVGVDWSHRKWAISRDRSTEVNPSACIGLQYRLSNSLAVYAEYSHTDSGFLGGGIRIR
jgi:opacity protein-like surface antigen